MYPELLKIFGITIHTYGFFIATGFLAGIVLAKHDAKRLGEDPEKIIDLCFWLIISGILGARLLYIATSPETYFKNPLEMLMIWKGGLVFYGGFIAAIITFFIYIKKNNLPLWKTMDIYAPSLAIGHAMGRVGCFFAGCCYGRECHLPWAVTFDHPATLARANVPLHPTQIYSAISLFILFAIIMFIKGKKKFDGQVAWIYILLYGITRSILETFRDDYRGEAVFDILSISQAIGLSSSIVAVCMLIFLFRKNRHAFNQNA